MPTTRRLCLALGFIVLLATGVPAAETPATLVTIRNVPIRMPDDPAFKGHRGATLWASIVYNTDAAGQPVPRPVIFDATAYGRWVWPQFYNHIASHGYNMLYIDNYGTGSSAGTWNALDLPEQHDIAWVIDHWLGDPAQTGAWCTGTVGMIGASYNAMVQLLAGGLIERDAQGNPAHFKAAFPIVPPSDVYTDIGVHGGNFDFEFIPLWIALTDFLALFPPQQLYDMDFATAQTVWFDHLRQIKTHLGLISNPDLEYLIDYFIIKSPMIYWPDKPEGGWRFDDGTPITETAGALPSHLPIFFTGGWYDLFTRGTLLNYQYALKDRGNKALVMGPWYHVTGFMGMGLDGMMMNMDIAVRWFDWKLKGVDDSFMREFPVLLYVMGAERWRAERDWPLLKTRLDHRTFYLSNTVADPIVDDWFSQANAANNFALVKDQAKIATDAQTPVVLWHTPPVLHGLTSRSTVRWIMGAPAMSQQRSKYCLGNDVDARMPWEDERLDEVGVLTFTTPVLPEPIEIAGPLKLTFWAQTKFCPVTAAAVQETKALIRNVFDIDDNIFSSLLLRPDVQWVVELNDVDERGRAKNITSGWLSARHRAYRDRAHPTEADPAYDPLNPDPFYFKPFLKGNADPIAEDTPYCYVIELWPTDNLFQPGHRIRLSISASDFPHLLPVLVPSKNTLILDDPARPAKLEYTAVNNRDQGVTWFWVSDVVAPAPDKQDNPILREFSAANNYLLNYREAPATAEDRPDQDAKTTQETASATADGGSSDRCFIAIGLEG